MYNPLPPRLTIKPSLISGLGLFATAGIAQGTNLGTTHIKIDGEIFRTPLGGFINCFISLLMSSLYQLPFDSSELLSPNLAFVLSAYACINIL